MSHRAVVQLTSLSFAHPDVPAEDRVQLLDPRTPVRGVDVFVMATCLRVELAWAGGNDMAPSILGQLYGRGDLPHARVRTDLDAFHHLARVAAGLESAQVGEAEVLAQYRQALDQLAGRTAGTGDLVRTMETALGVARAARRLLSERQRGSLAVAAARLVNRPADVFILGSGAMGRAVVRELKAARVTVFSRRSDRVGDAPTRPWEDLPQALASCQAVISTVPGPVPVLQEAERSGADPLLLVDLGMPPAIQMPHPRGVVYHGVDDVASSVPSAMEPDAEETAASESENAWRRLSVSPEARSLITSVVELVERTVDDEVRRFAHRFTATEEPDQVLRQLANSVARRIIHPSVSLLGSTPLTSSDLDVMAKALGVDRE